MEFNHHPISVFIHSANALSPPMFLHISLGLCPPRSGAPALSLSSFCNPAPPAAWVSAIH